MQSRSILILVFIFLIFVSVLPTASAQIPLIYTCGLAFFDQELKRDDNGFLENPLPDPDVTLSVLNPSQS